MTSIRRLTGLTLALSAALALAACGSPTAQTTPTSATSATTVSVATGFTPGLVAQVGTSSTVMVLGSAHCAGGLCLELWTGTVGSGGLVKRFSQLTAPPGGGATTYDAAGSVDSLVFANRLDGYAVEKESPNSPATTLYATTDGGKAWRLVSFGPNTVASQMVSTTSELYLVLDRCSGTDSRTTPQTCDDYRLARSTAGSTSWSSVPIRGTAALDVSPVGLAAEGTQVWLTYQLPKLGAVPVLLTSTGGKAPFEEKAEPDLASGSSCGLEASSGGVLWATCGYGMSATRFRSSDEGDHFTGFWTYAGTAGAVFDPVNGEVAYRFTGIAEKDPTVPANELQRTTDGGTHFTSVAALPSNPGGSTQLVFVSEADGFVLGSVVPSNGKVNDEVPTLLETDDGGRSWAKVAI